MRMFGSRWAGDWVGEGREEVSRIEWNEMDRSYSRRARRGPPGGGIKAVISGKRAFDVVEGDVRDFSAKEFKGVDLGKVPNGTGLSQIYEAGRDGRSAPSALWHRFITCPLLIPMLACIGVEGGRVPLSSWTVPRPFPDGLEWERSGHSRRQSHPCLLGKKTTRRGWDPGVGDFWRLGSEAEGAGFGDVDISFSSATPFSLARFELSGYPNSKVNNQVT